MLQENTPSETQIKSNMDAMYRWTRHIYDASRKYYLLGRDKLIERLALTKYDQICEIGCGTARNLIKIKKRYPEKLLYGIDASEEMLKTAQASIQKSGYGDSIHLAHGFAQSFSAEKQFGLKQPFNKFVFSYSLSIIPPWKESLEHVLEILPSGGEIYIVDFGSCAGQPAFVRAIIFWWLKLFHVYYKPEIEDYLRELDANDAGTLDFKQLYGGYCYLAKFTKA